jgi:hypothetical protein
MRHIVGVVVEEMVVDVSLDGTGRWLMWVR